MISSTRSSIAYFAMIAPMLAAPAMTTTLPPVPILDGFRADPDIRIFADRY